MANLMDKAQFNIYEGPTLNANNLQYIVQQAKQNPQAFEQQVKQYNPQAYEQAMRIRNSANPQAIIMQMARERGLNPNILKMLGIR